MEQHEHFSDEALLRHLDGEAAPDEQRAVTQHLIACWICRANLAELEGQIHALARSQREATLPGPGWPAEARWKFSVWREKQEALSNPVPSFAAPPPNRKRFPDAVWPVASAALIAIAMWAAWQWSGKRPEAEEMLAKAKVAEEAVYQQPVHQDFRVMISGHNSASQTWLGRLQIWSDPDHRRLSAKLTSSNGSIRHGVWRAEAGEEYIYNSQASSQPSRREAPANVVRASIWEFADDAREIEEGFIRWMDSRQWEPIGVSDAELLLAGVGGVLIRVETAAGQPDVTTVRAEGADGRFVELTIDTSEGLRRPRVRKIRLAHPSHSAELVLITDRAESFAGTQFHPAIFRPDPSLYQREVARKPRPQSSDIRPGAAEPVIPQASWPSPPPASSLATKIEVYYALHGVGACLGEPVHVISTDLGITVEGLVETTARKNELLRVLDALPSGNSVSVEIRSVSEMAVPADPVPNRQQGRGPTLVRAQEPPIQQSIRSFLRSQAGEAERDEENLGQRATKLSSDAVRWSESLMAHSWSLRRLTDALSAERSESLAVRSRVLVENIVADHLRTMRESIGAEGRQVMELLVSIQGEGQGNGPAAGVHGEQSMHRPGEQDSLFESVSAIDGMVRMLLAGDLGIAASGSAHRAAIGNEDPTASAAALLVAIQQVDRRLDLLIEQPIAVVFQRTAVASQAAARGGRARASPKTVRRNNDR